MTLNEALKLEKKYDSLLNKWGITTPLRRTHFFAQMYHESLFILKAENMNYSATRIMQIFGVGKHSAKVTQAEANKLAGKPQELGERVYGLGNPTKAKEFKHAKVGDGYKYRGRPFLMITGKVNYEALSKASGVDYVNNPDLLLREADAMIAACWYWKTNNLNKYADIDDLDGVSDVVNRGHKTSRYGDAINFKDREEKYRFFKSKFKA